MPRNEKRREDFTDEEVGIVPENAAYIEGMACSITLVFACEAHREAWLTKMGVFEGEYGECKQRDYERRRENTNLMYSASAIRAPPLKDVLPPRELSRAWAYLEQELRGSETFRFERCNSHEVDVALFTHENPSDRVGFMLHIGASFDQWKEDIDSAYRTLRSMP